MYCGWLIASGRYPGLQSSILDPTDISYDHNLMCFWQMTRLRRPVPCCSITLDGSCSWKSTRLLIKSLTLH